MFALLSILGLFSSCLTLSNWTPEPSLIVDPVQLRVYENHPVIICCRLYGGDANTSLHWEPDRSVKVVEIKSTFLGQNVQETCLVISHTPLAAAGSYICRENVLGLSKEATLQVVAPPLVNPVKEKVTKGESANFNCTSVSYTESTKLVWGHNQEVLQQGNTSITAYLIREGHQDLKDGSILFWSYLELIRTILSDSGIYTCTDPNTGVMASSELFVIEIPLPHAIPNRQKVSLGEKAAINCNVISSNSTKLFWRHNGRRLNSIGWEDPLISMYIIYDGITPLEDGTQMTWSVLHLYRVISEAQGIYECIDKATGISATAIVDVDHQTVPEPCEYDSDCKDSVFKCLNFRCLPSTTTFKTVDQKNFNNGEVEEEFFYGMKLVFACLMAGGVVVGLLMMYVIIKFFRQVCHPDSRHGSRRSSSGRSQTGSVVSESDKPPTYDQCLWFIQPPSYEDVTARSDSGSVRSSPEPVPREVTSTSPEAVVAETSLEVIISPLSAGQPNALAPDSASEETGTSQSTNLTNGEGSISSGNHLS